MLPRSFTTRALPAALSLALLAGCAACGGDDDPAPTPTTTTRPTTTTTTEAELTDEEQIEALLTEWHDVTREIYGQDRPVSDASNFIAGEYLERYERDLADFQAAGYGVQYSDESRIVVESVTVTGDIGTAVVCVVDADIKLDPTSGSTVDDDVVFTRYTNDVAREPSGWRIVLRNALPGEVTRCP